MHSKEELQDLILNNSDEYKKFKASIGDEELDLSELDFSNANLEEIDFSNADLSGSTFCDSHLSLVNFTNCDLKAVDFTRANVVESDFSDSILNGTDFNFAVVDYCNFTGADTAGTIFIEADLTNSDLSASENLIACRFDESTVWPDLELLPEEFDTTYSKDLSSLEDDDDSAVNEY